MDLRNEENVFCETLKEHLRQIEKAYPALDSRFSGPEYERLVSDIGRNFYKMYPFWFAEMFPNISNDILHRINLCSIFVFTHMMSSDKIVDDPTAASRSRITTSSFMLVNATRVLSEFFPVNSLFWEYFDKYYAQHVYASLTEIALLSGGSNERWDTSRFEETAKGRAALAKFVPAAMAVLSGDVSNLTYIEDSQDAFHIAFQTYDDLVDWREDFLAKRTSFLLSQVFDNCVPFNKQKSPDLETVGRILYFSGIAEKMLETAYNHFSSALDLVKELSCEQWKLLIKTKRVAVEMLKYDLEQLRIKELGRHSKSPKPSRKSGLPRRHLGKNRRDYNAAILKGLDFLRRNQRTDGRWQDFPLNVGFGDEYVTAYVGGTLCRIVKHDFAGELIKPMIERAAKWVIQAQRKSGGWGWNEAFIEDSDTSANCLLFLTMSGYGQDASVGRGVKFILEAENLENGGIRTYSPGAISAALSRRHPFFLSNSVEGYSGWYAPDPTITSVVVSALDQLKNEGWSGVLSEARRFISEQQNPDGSWNAYWFASRVMATSLCIQALDSCSLYAENVSSGRQWISGMIDTSTVGVPINGDQVNPFELAAAVIAINDLENSFCLDLKSKLDDVISQQLDDGGWPPSCRLQIPESWVLNPKDPKAKKSISYDRLRIFTTVTVVNSLSKYLRFQL